jgi:hypothetical protein
MNTNDNQARSILQDIAKRAMLERGLLPDFSAEALAELDEIQAPATTNAVKVRDLRDLIWASIEMMTPRPDQLPQMPEICESDRKKAIRWAIRQKATRR